VAAFFTGLISALKGVAAARDLVNQFVAMWLEYQDRKIESEYDDKKAEREGLIFLLKTAPTDEVRKDAARKLYRLGQS
jgi:hypothetical protein